MEETDNIKYYIFQQSINNVISQTTLSKFIISDILIRTGEQMRSGAYHDLKMDVQKMNEHKQDSNDTNTSNESE